MTSRTLLTALALTFTLALTGCSDTSEPSPVSDTASIVEPTATPGSAQSAPPSASPSGTASAQTAPEIDNGAERFVYNHIQSYPTAPVEVFCARLAPEYRDSLVTGVSGEQARCENAAPEIQEIAAAYDLSVADVRSTLTPTLTLVEVTYVEQPGFVETYSLIANGKSWLISGVSEN